MTWPGKRSVTKPSDFLGGGRFDYTSVPEPELSAELERSSNATRKTLDGLRLDSVTFQPCLDPDERSQDRLFSASIPNFGVLVIVFDGHAGHETADHAVQHLPTAIQDALAPLGSVKKASADDITSALAQAISDFDAKVENDIRALFPSDPAAIESMPEEEIDSIVRDNLDVILRGMRGTTALVALYHKESQKLWTANLGDCEALLIEKAAAANWTAEQLTKNHNGGNSTELERIRTQHPGEHEVTLRNRVLGAIAVTRALGDMLFKLPKVFSDRIFMSKASPGFVMHADQPRAVINRIRTPPYLSREADVTFTDLSTIQQSASGSPKALVLYSDGLPSLAVVKARAAAAPRLATVNDDFVEQRARERAAKTVGNVLDGDASSGNAALAVLRDALGGADPDEVSKYLTVEMMGRWIDDTTILVLQLS